MKRPIFTHVDGFSGSATTYTMFHGGTPGTFAGSGRKPWLVAGVLRDWRIVLAVAPGSGKSFTFTIRINGVDSAMSVTIADLATSGSYTAGDISVAALDTVEIKSVPSGSPSSSDASMSVEFDSTSHVDSCYGGGVGSMVGGQTRYTTPFRVEQFTIGVSTGDIVAVAGAITGLATCCATSFAGGSYTTSIYLNGVNQDGSGGTVDTLLSHSVSSTLTAVTSKSFTLPVAAGDLVYVEVISPGLGTTTFISLGFQLTASTAGESQITGNSSGTLSANNFHRLGVATGNGSVSEGVVVLQTVGLTEFSLSDLWWGLTAAPVGVTSRTVTVRQNSADSALAATVSGANTVSSDLVDSIPFVTGDTFAIRHTVSGSPAAASGKWSAVITVDIVAPTIVGTSIFGEEGHVAGLSRVHLVNLDGTPRTLNDPALEGTVYIGGNLIVTGETTVEDLVINGTFTLPADSVTNTELANMAQDTIKGRASGAGTGDPTDLSANQVSTILDAATDPFLRTSAAGGAGTLDGLSDVIITAPATGEVLKYDGTDWVNDAAAGGGGAMVLVSSWTYSSNVPNVDFTGLGGYSELVVIARLLTASVSDIRSLWVSVDNGSTFYTSSGDYVNVLTAGTEAAAAAVGFHGTNASAARSGVIHIQGSNVNGGPKAFTIPNRQADGLLSRLFVASTSPIDAIRVGPGASGNLTGGSIYVFGRP